MFDQIKKFKKFTENQTALIFKQILQGMNYMHNMNFCHWDIKPENIFIDAESWVLKIGDLGAATTFEKDQYFNEMFGTPFYIAPEVL